MSIDQTRPNQPPVLARLPDLEPHEPPSEREAARRALAETQEAIRSGELAAAGDKAVRDFELSVAGKPEPGESGEVVARVVALGKKEEGVPAVPLQGVLVRLKVDGQVVSEGQTGALGLVTLSIGGEPRDASYEVEVSGNDCAVLACQPGRVTPKSGAGGHLIELPRTNAVASYVERAQPLERAVRAARERAVLGEAVIKKALAEQEKQLVEYLASLDDGGSLPPKEPLKEPAPEEPVPMEPAPEQPSPKEPPPKEPPRKGPPPAAPPRQPASKEPPPRQPASKEPAPKAPPKGGKRDAKK